MILKQETKEKFGYDVDSLKLQSEKLCLLVCDYCGMLFERRFSKYNVGRINIQKDACSKKECQSNKRSDAFEHKYGKGIRTALQNPESLKKQQKTTEEKYGVKNVFSSEIIKTKIKQTNLDKYGVENPQQNKKIKEKTKQTLKQRTGYDFPLQDPETLKKTEDKIEEKFGVRHYEELQKKPFSEIIELCNKKQYQIFFEEEDYRNKQQKLLFGCIKHPEEKFNSNLSAVMNNIHQCPRCQDVYSSKQEQEIFDFIISLGVPENEIVRRDRKIIGMEMDLYLSKRNFAIEHHGLYYHTEEFKERELHFKKFFCSKEQNIKLFQIFGDEWQEKQDICKSMIRSRLGFSNKMNARDCFVLKIDSESNKKIKRKIIDFINENHLQGNSSGTLNYFALLNKKTNEIIACVSLRKTMNTKSRKDIQDPNIEIARFCCKKGDNVRGGFSKILKKIIFWAKEQKYSEIFTYSDCRYSWGEVYEKNGFIYKGHTGIGFYYLIKGERYQRFPLRLLTENQSLEECAEENGIYKIYNAGHYRWELKI